jgi:hypothetical protein
MGGAVDEKPSDDGLSREKLRAYTLRDGLSWIESTRATSMHARLADFDSILMMGDCISCRMGYGPRLHKQSAAVRYARFEIKKGRGL